MECILCQEFYIPHRKCQVYCEKCINAAKILHRREQQKIYYHKHKIKTPLQEIQHKPASKIYKLCKTCSIIFISNSSRQIYCKNCSNQHKKEYQKNYNTQYRQTEIGKIAYKKLNYKRRAKLNSIKESFTMEQWFKKVDETNGICPGYNREPHFVGKDKLTLDHIIPISIASDGFIYTINDIQPLCCGCNSKKGNKNIQ